MAAAVFGWGSAKYGQLGIGGSGEENVLSPKEVLSLQSLKIKDISCGERHSLLLTQDGAMYSCGNNDYGQLGQKNSSSTTTRFEKVESLTNMTVTQVVVGANHCLALTSAGEVFSWGDNSKGQLGRGPVSQAEQRNTKLVKDLAIYNTVQIASGAYHCLALTDDGKLFSWGDNTHGQLGLGPGTAYHDRPQQIMSLRGIPLAQITAGGYHSFVLSLSRAVFGWGKNWRHTLAFVMGSRRLYSFGCGGCGQQGSGNTGSRNAPGSVHAPFLVGSNVRNSQTMDHSGQLYSIKRLYAGGDHCFVQVEDAAQNDCQPDDYRDTDPSKSITYLTAEKCDAVRQLTADQSLPVDLTEDLTKIFSSAACLNASFLLPDEEHYGCSSKKHGLDMDEVRRLLNRIGDAVNISIIQKIVESIEHLLSSLPSSPPDVEALRLYLILPELHIFDQPKYFSTLITPFGASLNNLDKAASRILDLWWGSLKSRFIARLVYVFKQTIVYILQLPDSMIDREMASRFTGVRVSLEVLKKLNTVSEKNGQIVPYHHFYIPELKDKVNIKQDYAQWVQQNMMFSRPHLSFCNYPFVFDGAAKSMLLQTDAFMQMQTAYEEVQRRNIQSLFLPIDPVSPMLVLHVTRPNIVTDTLHQLEKQGPADLKKPLRRDCVILLQVIFMGEEAVDEGGVRKEFFLLLLREIMDPKYGMFKVYEESRLQWFNPMSFEDKKMFHLIGCLCGLAIYNSTIIQLDFPLVLYKKLLRRKPDIEDLREIMPSVGKGMQDLLEYDGDDIEDVFALSFEVTVESFGSVHSVPLVNDGANKSVNRENRQEYIDLYIDFIFNKSVENQYSGFQDGFLKVCGGRVLELFHPQELQAMVVGNENYDFLELEKNTMYKGDYHRYHPTIVWFWDVFHELPLDDKKKFLMYLTGSDRIPILGMQAVRMFIQPTEGGDKYLPVAHTCFNLLDLPKYSSKQILQEKLTMAIEQTEGFGIV
ncbi:hypothetical protein FSP39_002760 [Pinctada imbricata]|uniref:HECT domain-containing protein n=1 Tax=Pinctada imbricata TaxID=66713 RepID=A0AA88XNM5_PINIB|nr:hypothetical protein FSP39_002760 [Pinctada imbricata]